MLKNKVSIAAIAFAAAAMLLTTAAFAEDNSGKNNNAANPGMSVNINPSGKASLRGIMDSVGTSSISVKSWGGLWTINIGSNTKLVRRFGGASNLSEFQK